MDSFGTIDAYVRLDYLGKTLKTRWVTQRREEDYIIWEQEFQIPLQIPIVSDRVVFKVYDYDRGTADELVASLKFHLSDYINKSESFWANLYGVLIHYPLGLRLI